MITISYNKPSAYGFPRQSGQIILLPGLNIGLPDDLEGELRSHPITKILIEEGVITIVKSTPTGVEVAPDVEVVKQGGEEVPVTPTAAKKSRRA